MKDDSNGKEIEIVAQREGEGDYPSSVQQESASLKASVGGGTSIPESATFSSVAVGAGSKKFLIVGIAAVLLGVGYFVYQNFKSATVVEKTPSQKIQERSEAEAEKLVKSAKPIAPAEDVAITHAPQLPAPVPIQTPQPPEPPPPPVPLTPQSPIFPQSASNDAVIVAPQPFSPASTTRTLDVFNSRDDEQARLKALEERRKASIMVLGGSSDSLMGGGKDSGKDKDGKDKDDKEKKKADKTGFLGFGDGTLNEGGIGKTKASQVKATQIGNLDHMITQGKLIHAVLETAINTDIPGPLRAIVARDIYGESGKSVLIPKGSRVVGTYEANLKVGHTRVAVIWNRLIRPDGVDIALDSPGTDTLGRSGIPGFLDDKFLTKLSNALLVSYVIPKVAENVFGANTANNTPITTTATNNPQTGATTTSTTSTFKQQQLKDSQDKFTQVLDKALQETFSTTPTLFVDQGTEVNIFVNKDLIFPASAAVGGMQVLR